MIPVLYSSDTLTFESNGIGVLADAISCKCSETLNGAYEIELQIPIEGGFAEYIAAGRIIKVKPNLYDNPQPFRIYSVEKKIDGTVTVKAAHISYDTDGLPVLPFEAENLEDTISNLNSNRKTTYDSVFTIYNMFSKDGEFKVDALSSFRSLLGDGEKTVIGVYGGEYYFDMYNIYLLEQRGYDRGICFRSGKNIVEFEQQTDAEEFYNSIVGYWKGGSENSPSYVYSEIYTMNDYLPYEKIYILQVSNDDLGISKSATPTADQMNDYIEKYISEHEEFGTPKYSMTITYAEDDNITDITLGDTVGVVLPEYRINASARCTKVVFDCLLERNESIELGTVNPGIAEEIALISEYI